MSKNTFIFRPAMCLVLFFGMVCVASGDDGVEGEIPSKVFFVKANSLLDSRSSYSSASALWTPDGHLIQEEPLADADLILMLFSDPDAGAELSSSLDEPEEDYIKSRNSDSGLSFSQSGGRNSSSHSSITGSDPSPADQFPDVSAGWFLVSEVVNKEPSPFQLILSSLMNLFFASSTRVDSFNSPGDQIVEQVTKNQRGEDLRRLFSRSLLHIVEDVVVEGTPRVRIVQIRDHIQQELEEAYRSARQGEGVVTEYQPLALYRAEMRGRVRQIAYASESGLNRRSSVGAGRLEVLFETIDDLMRLSQARLEYQGVEEELTSVTRPIYQAGFQDVVQPRFRLESRTGEDLMSVLAPIFRNYQLDGRDVLEGRTAYFLSAHLFLAGLEYETLDIGRPHSAEMSQEKKLSEDPLKVTREEEGFISNGVRMDTIHALRESTRLPSDERVWTGEALVYPLERAGGGHPFGRNRSVPGAKAKERKARYPVQASDQEQEGVSNGGSQLFDQLPNEMLCKIFEFLPLQGYIALSRVNRSLNRFIKDDHAIEKKWFGQLPLSLQEQQKKMVTEKDRNQLRDWLAQFSNDHELIESVLNKKEKKYFPALFLFTISQLMHKCTTFKVDTKTIINHNDLVGSATFSADGRHVVTASADCTAKIYGLSTDGSWKEKLIITHDKRVNSATFSADGHHVMTVSVGHMVRIFGQSDDGSWKEKLTITNGDWAGSATFSANGRHAVTTSADGAVKIAGQSDDGSWEVKLIITHDKLVKSATFSADSRHVVITPREGTVEIVSQSDDGSWKEILITHVCASATSATSATFSADGHHVVIASADHTAKIAYQRSDGSWEEKLIITHDKRVNSATFSADGRHVMTTSDDGTVKIFGQSDDESWEEKLIITHDKGVSSATFSDDGRHVVIVSRGVTGVNGAAIIAGRSADGSWKEKLTINHNDLVDSATFSDDGRHVVTNDMGNTVKITGQSADGSWKEKLTITHSGPAHIAAFSADGCHMVSTSRDGAVKILGQSADGSWKEKLNIEHDKFVSSATFSADGCHVVTASNDRTVKIAGRCADGSWKVKATITHDACVTSATFSADGRHVVTASTDRTAKIATLRSDSGIIQNIFPAMRCLLQ